MIQRIVYRNWVRVFRPAGMPVGQFRLTSLPVAKQHYLCSITLYFKSTIFLDSWKSPASMR